MEKHDYCTFFPENILGHDISGCCKKHDEAYELQQDKYQSDVELMKCVAEQGEQSLFFVIISVLMFLAVSWFGWIFYNKKK